MLNQTNKCEELLKIGADPNIRDSLNSVPLIYGALITMHWVFLIKEINNIIFLLKRLLKVTFWFQNFY